MVERKICGANSWSFGQNRGEFRLIYHPSNFIVLFFKIGENGLNNKWTKIEFLVLGLRGGFANNITLEGRLKSKNDVQLP